MPILNHELNGYVRYFGSLVPHTLTGTDYVDFAAMKADHDSTGRIKINVDHSTGTIFGDPTINWLFRAWHDSCHLISGGDFTAHGEYLAYREMIRQLWQHPDLVNDEDTRWELSFLLHAEIVGQGAYYMAHGEFPENQYQFTRDFHNVTSEYFKLVHSARREFPVYPYQSN